MSDYVYKLWCKLCLSWSVARKFGKNFLDVGISHKKGVGMWNQNSPFQTLIVNLNLNKSIFDIPHSHTCIKDMSLNLRPPTRGDKPPPL